MRLTQHTDFALRTLIYLAVSDAPRVRVADISSAYDVSHHHLTKVVQKLQRAGFVETARGQQGGVSLARPPEEINIGAVVRQLETVDHLVECFHPDGRCAIHGACALPRALAQAVEAFMSELDRQTLADICAINTDRLRTSLKLS
ncbi:Rrf2 family transcriptional regulator [Pseudohaliea sp.]|uniref:RrF2 family transcriptional regulator n=1 Tax=Pseudohaliea sp. TaxID=2740289 RepID=UPI0032EDBBB9